MTSEFFGVLRPSLLEDRTLDPCGPEPAHRWPGWRYSTLVLIAVAWGGASRVSLRPKCGHRTNRVSPANCPSTPPLAGCCCVWLDRTCAAVVRRPRAETSETAGVNRMAVDAALYSRSKRYFFDGNRYLRMTQPGVRNAGIERDCPANPRADMGRPSLAPACPGTYSDHFGVVRARIAAPVGGEDGFLDWRNKCRSKPRH
jgi:hypothetical protein